MTADNAVLVAALDEVAFERLGAWPPEWEEYHWPGYTYEHTIRVRNLAVELARREGADQRIVELAALLHDIRKDAGRQHAAAGAEEARQILMEHAVDEETLERVCAAITAHAGDNTSDSPIENCALGDADLIDANFGLVAVWRFITIRSGHGMPLAETVVDMGRWLRDKDGLLPRLLNSSGRQVGRQRCQRMRVFCDAVMEEIALPAEGASYGLLAIAREIHADCGRRFLEEQLVEFEALAAKPEAEPVVSVACRSLRAEVAGEH